MQRFNWQFSNKNDIKKENENRIDRKKNNAS